MDKQHRNPFAFDDRSLRTLGQLKAEGLQFVEYGSLTIPVQGTAGSHTPTSAPLTAGDVPYPPVPTTAGNMTSAPTPQLLTPYARLTQALWEHRLALTGTDVEARCQAMSAIYERVHHEWDQALEALVVLRRNDTEMSHFLP